MTDADSAVPRLAAIVFGRDEDPDAPLGAVVAAAARAGAHVAGFLQERQCEGCERRDARLRDLASGESLPVMQDLGAYAEGCRVDPAAVAAAAQRLGAAIERGPDLVVANRFGRLESEGSGLLAEIGEAVAREIAVIVCVPRRYLEAWNAFSGGLDAQLPPQRDAIEAWWRAQPSARQRD